MQNQSSEDKLCLSFWSPCGLAGAPKGIREQGREPLVQERLNEQSRIACNVNSRYSCMSVLQQSYMDLSVIQLILFVEFVSIITKDL